MGDMALEMAYQEMHGRDTEGRTMGYPSPSPDYDSAKMPSVGYQRLFAEIEQTLERGQDAVSRLQGRLSLVINQSDEARGTAPMEPRQAPNCELDQKLDNVYREVDALVRRIEWLTQDLAI